MDPQESIEAVLNLTCTECGKPCRSQTDVDLHKKRTGHEKYVDKVGCHQQPRCGFKSGAWRTALLRDTFSRGRRLPLALAGILSTSRPSPGTSLGGMYQESSGRIFRFR